MPVRAHCPHCITPCLVAEQHLGVPVRCHKCGQAFTVQPTVLTSKPPSTEPIPPTAGALRLEIAGVTSVGRERSRNEDSFLVVTVHGSRMTSVQTDIEPRTGRGRGFALAHLAHRA